VTSPASHPALSAMVAVVVTYTGEASTVQVAGEFTAGGGHSWLPVSLARGQAGGWSTTLHLAPGCYHYKLVVDGAWVLVPGQEQEQDTRGNTNSVLIVEEMDEVEKDNGKVMKEQESGKKDMKENEQDAFGDGEEKVVQKLEKLEGEVKKTGLERIVEKEIYRKPSEGNGSFVLKLNDTLDYEELNKDDDTPAKIEKVEKETLSSKTDENKEGTEPKVRENDSVRQDLVSFKDNFNLVTSPIETKQETSVGINEDTMKVWEKVVMDAVKLVTSRKKSQESTKKYPEHSDDVVKPMSDLNIKTGNSRGKKKAQARKKTIDIEEDDDLVGPGPPAIVVEKAFVVQAEAPRVVKVKGEARERPRRVTRAATRASYSAGAS